METIPLNRGYIALVDDADHQIVSPYRWSVHIRRDKNYSRMYAKHTFRENGHRVTKFMHCYIMNYTGGLDHADGNGPNNQRENLRRANQSQNTANQRKSPGCSSKFKGVTKEPNCNRWRAKINSGGIKYELGLFKDEVDAATAYNFKAYELFGEFAKFNTPAQIL